MKIDGVDFNFSSERHKSFPIRISLNRDITLKRQIIIVIINHEVIFKIPSSLSPTSHYVVTNIVMQKQPQSSHQVNSKKLNGLI
jgi:hypothetical protein